MATIVTAPTNPLRKALTEGGAIPTGHVRLSCGDPPLDLIALLGSEAPRLTGGVGGWSVVERPETVSMTLWNGVEPYQLSLSLMLDGWDGRRSQEKALGALVRVARGDSESPPGVLRVEGIRIPAQRWVIEGIDFGDPILSLNGNRLRQPLTLTLRQYVPPKYAKRRKSAYGSSTKTVIVRAQRGDTPAKIAKRRRLKSWTVIRDLNRKVVKKANQKLKTGTKIRVPKTKTQARGGGKDKDRRKR